ncbi:MAG TPA: assimilatory sulfite reductase (NADPH) hemoprotein subunit [Gammaproteobacteria bacterium]|nr:assimilatory sulfite reductase (NADPH) hemoprotein subunit [Gammaproteobacteria bacterium]
MTATPNKPPSPVEDIKARSHYLRGTLPASLAERTTGALGHDDTRVAKFHGIYQQDNRDIRAERAAQRLEPAYDFMIRIRLLGGRITSGQWLAVDKLAQLHSSGTLRLTTRQAIQLHGVLKQGLPPTMAGLGAALLTTIAACGDVNRNVVCSPLPASSAVHRAVLAHAEAIARRLTPATRAYHEVWLNGERNAVPVANEEPIYGATYLPRKFKIGFAVPPHNDIDVYAQDLGFVALAANGELVGFNVAVGGGMGATHGNARTYPRLAETLGACKPGQALAVAEHVLGIQRDHGDRSERSHSRLKYTIDDRGIDWFRAELERRLGWSLAPAVPVEFTGTGDRLGWIEGDDGRAHLTLLVPAGRVADVGGEYWRTGLNAIAALHGGELRVTPNQNLIVAGVRRDERAAIEALVAEHGLDAHSRATPLRREALACVALPTCGLAMAEAERYLPQLLGQLEALLAKHGLTDEPISLRVTGCPNGCARPYLAEVALIGKAPGRYNLLLGGGRTGDRLNRLYRQNLAEPEILRVLDELLGRFARERGAAEPFGDFLVRARVLDA